MMKYMLLLAILVCTFSFAQDMLEDNSDDLGQSGVFITRELPKWSIKEEVTTIEKSLSNYDPLIQSLGDANKDLQEDLANYLKNPGDQVLAARITAKMSKYAKSIVNNVDKITSDQDVLLTVFNEVDQKLKQFSGYMDSKVGDLTQQLNKYVNEELSLKRELKSISKRWKASNNPAEKEKYQQEFRKLYNKYNLNARYKDGRTRNQRDYEVLSKNLKGLIQVFSVLHDSFDTLIENLASEKQYLVDNIKLQADAIRVQKLVHEGISDGSRAVVKITEKLAVLYAQVDGFAKVHEKINQDMAKFSDTTKVLGALVQQVEQTPFKNAPTIEKAMEMFANDED